MDFLVLRKLNICHRIRLKKSSQFHTTCKTFKHFLQKTQNPFEPLISEVIDVRTEDEFLDDHIPGAQNFPVLHQAEHVRVGIQYASNSFQARKTGAKYVTSNISHHIDKYFQHKDESYSPLVYCWRGGQRSHTLAIVLAEIGFPVFVLEGGYKTYRRLVREQLETLPEQLTFKVLSGLTGTGKTHLLHQLSERGQQVLDLEGLAQHKGSCLGLWYNQLQPSQKYWESLLRERLAQFEPNKPVWVESESRKVGNVTIPTTLFRRVCEGKRYNISLPIAERVRHIMRDYPYFITDIETLKTSLAPLEKYLGKKKIQQWFELIRQSRFEEFVESMLRDHYDPTYSRSQAKSQSHSCEIQPLQLDSLEKEAVDMFLHQILDNT